MKNDVKTERDNAKFINSLQTEKLLLEISKLEREIKFLKRPLTNPINWPPLVTFMISIFGIIIALSVGKYTIEKQKNEIEQLKISISNARIKEINYVLFKKEDSLEREIKRLDTISKRLKQGIK